MADITKIVSHKSECEMALMPGDGESINIAIEYIKNFASDYKFEDNFMPIFYVVLDVDIALYDKIIDSQADGKIYLNVRNFNKKEENALHLDTVNDVFIYFIPTQYNKSNEFTSEEQVTGKHFKHIVLGLMKEEIIKQFKTPFNAVYTETNTQELLENLLEKMGGEDVVMDEIEVDTDYEQFILPPQDSIANAIDYLFKQEPFFRTGYQFFMDLAKTYLLNSTGVGREETVLIDIRDISDKESFYDGCSMDEGTYTIYVNKSDVNFHINGTTEKNLNAAVGVQTEEVSVVDIDMLSNEEAPARANFFNQSGLGLTTIKQQIIQNTIVEMTVIKRNMDASQITPDKQYLVSSPGYEQYNGLYLLVNKQEILSKTGFEFNTTTNLTFKRIAAGGE